MTKYFFASLFSLLIAVALFDPRLPEAVRGNVELVQGGGGNAHGCPKGQQYSKATRTCGPKAK